MWSGFERRKENPAENPHPRVPNPPPKVICLRAVPFHKVSTHLWNFRKEEGEANDGIQSVAKDTKIVSTLQETLTLCSAQIHDIQKSLCESCSETCSCLSLFNESKALGGIVRTPRLNLSQPPGKQSSSAAQCDRHAAVYFDRWLSSPAPHLLWHNTNL